MLQGLYRSYHKWQHEFPMTQSDMLLGMYYIHMRVIIKKTTDILIRTSKIDKV